MVAAGILFLNACASTRTQEGTGEFIDDSVITSKVKEEIFDDSDLKLNEIHMETFKRMVELSGFIKSATDERKAIAIARHVKGVKAVKDNMRTK